MRLKSSSSIHAVSLLAASTVAISLHGGCGGGTGTGNPQNGNVTVQSAPFSGPNAAFRGTGRFDLASLLGIASAFAASPSCQFLTFQACNDTFVFIDNNGVQLNVNGSTNPSVGQGLLTFNYSSTTPMNIGSVNIPTGTALSEIDITFAKVPTVCSGATYAVQFDPGTGQGLQTVTQNVAFKFKYGNGGLTIGGTQTLTLLFGSIVTQMCTIAQQAGGLNNTSIQTVSSGLFQ